MFIYLISDPAFACGITSVSEEGVIFTGTSNGNITAILVPTASGEAISFHSTLATSDFPVLCLGASSEVIAAGNDNGDVFGFSSAAGTKFDRKCKFNGSGYPCTAVCVREDTVFAAFSLGNIRVYNTSQNELKIEVSGAV